MIVLNKWFPFLRSTQLWRNRDISSTSWNTSAVFQVFQVLVEIPLKTSNIMHKLKYLRYLCSGEAFLPLGSKMERPWLLLLGSLIDTTCWPKSEMCKNKETKICKIYKIWKISSRWPVGQSAGRPASRGSSCIPSATRSSPMEAVVRLAAALSGL